MKDLRNTLMLKVSSVHLIGCMFMFFAAIHLSHCVEIRRLSVPRWIQNGTEDSVVLDCEYVYNENDLRLVVKWFFDDNLEPIYQWIPELDKRFTSGVLLNRLDLDFAVNTADAYSRFRALRIRKPSTELSGKYTCLVTSLAGQDSREQVMTVYVPANGFELSYSELSYSELNDSYVNVTCEAQGLFPPPVLKLYLASSAGGTSPNIVPEVTSSTKIHISGAYDAHLHRTFSRSELLAKDADVFECTLELPGTNYLLAKRIAYYPGIHGLQIDAAHSVSSTSRRIASSWSGLTSMFSILYMAVWSLIILDI